MGTWGTGISSNDVYEDIYYEFFELYNQGMEVSEITKRLIQKNQEIVDSYYDQNNFWIAIAKCQWECKSLDPKILNQIKEIVESGKDIELWKELDASQSDLTKREKILKSFIEKISVEKKIAIKRKIKKLRDAIFEKGDCLVFKLDESHYGGVFVLEAEKNTEFGLNLICYLDIKQSVKPTLECFKKAKIIVTKGVEYDHSFDNEKLTSFKEKIIDFPEVCWKNAEKYKKSNIEFDLIGNLKVSKNYNSNIDFQCFSQWDNIIPNINAYYENIHSRKGCKELKLRELRMKYWL